MTIGGQAVLEGVMMRTPSNWAVAVRKPDGEIAEVNRPIRSVMARHWFFRLPIVRGIIALGDGRQECRLVLHGPAHWSSFTYTVLTSVYSSSAYSPSSRPMPDCL